MKVRLSEKLDSLDSLVSQLKKTSDEIGGIAVFMGAVRGTHGDERVLRLEYEAHETLAPRAIEKIIEDTKATHGIIDAIVEHKVGSAFVGEDVMYVLVSSKHRKEAFDDLEEMVDRIKNEVPIWKKEVTDKEAYWAENP